ncbi:hypothetical protein DYB32_003566 [Aphanomyces invadans]|uniref:RING-type domain-containing protein n=1 Tax=Aphanomyces invadans TaxID=157072 RepID=A0A418B0A0_9STRA|nr:hypothetical protein DYB32_003566 [Aphanomyces invadans]
MGRYISSLAATIRQVFAVIKLLFRGRVKLHVVSYKDYCDGKLVVTHRSQRTHSNKQILEFVADLVPHGGGDIPEAIKTALNFVHSTVNSIREASAMSTEALVLIFTDAPPHHSHTLSRYWRHERDAIQTNPTYTAGYDWLSIRRAFQVASIPVFTFHSNLDCAYRTAQSVLFYSALGPVVLVENESTTEITKATMGLLLQLMGHKFEFSDLFTCVRVWADCAAFGGDAEDAVFPDVDARLTCTRLPFQFDALPWMDEDVSPLPALFETNVEYQRMVYHVFGALVTPTNVLALTYNPILAKLWRLICKRRSDPRYASLTTTLSLCVPALTGLDKQQVQQWIHNESHAIRDTIMALTHDIGSSDRRIIVLERNTLLDSVDPADLRSLARAPTPNAIRTVQSILTHLQLVTLDDDRPTDGLIDRDGVPHFLPLDLPDIKLFSFLCHLVAPGTVFSVRGSAVVAMLCVSSNHSIMKDRAHDFLHSIRGTWLPLDVATDYPEILSVEYIKLLHRHRQFLTPNELVVYDRLYAMHRMRLAATKDVDVTVGATPVKAQLRLDIKAKCLSCNTHVSVSLMTTKDLCAICVEYGLADARAIQRKHITPVNKSHMVECTVCHCLYAVVQPELLNIAPKCFYCRQWVKPRPIAPVVECVRCLNKYLDPAHLIEAPPGDVGWTCTPCIAVAPQAATMVKTVPFKTIMESNLELSREFGWTKPKRAQEFVDLAFNQHTNYFKLYTQHHALLFGVKPAQTQRHSQDKVIVVLVDGKPIHDAESLCKALVFNVLEGSLRDVCNLCFEEFSLPQLDSACGRCPTRVCQGCIGQWYGEVKIGRVLFTSHLTCPFCRQKPQPSVWLRYNKAARELATSPMPAMKANAYYGWCSTCGKIKEMMPKSCARDVPRLAKYECDDCIAKSAIYPQCPRCKVQTERIDGCNHILCICGQNWCYACGEEFESADSTYSHMYRECQVGL